MNPFEVVYYCFAGLIALGVLWCLVAWWTNGLNKRIAELEEITNIHTGIIVPVTGWGSYEKRIKIDKVIQALIECERIKLDVSPSVDSKVVATKSRAKR